MAIASPTLWILWNATPPPRGFALPHRSGIFFKALANFQWDRLLKTDIVSKAYLDGCYKLGQRYPDLCASIFLVCEKGDRETSLAG